MSHELLEGALALARGGIPVISLRPRSKVPIHTGWPSLGMLDLDAIELEWSLNPASNVGVLCGPEAFDGKGLTILDVDLPDGPGTLEALMDEHGSLPLTTMVFTPSGGAHHYFAGHTASWNPGPGLEVRSAGRQCAAPPSVGAGGVPYLWTMEAEGFAPLPSWLTKAEAKPKRVDSPWQPLAGTGLRDPVLEVSPRVYFPRLTGLAPNREGFVCCPFHGEIEPSLKVYATADRGWFCYGESCRRGGDIVTLVCELAGIDTPVTGYRFVTLLDYLRGRLS